MELQIIQQKIFEVRGCRVMLDFHLAELYGVQTKVVDFQTFSADKLWKSSIAFIAVKAYQLYFF